MGSICDDLSQRVAIYETLTSCYLKKLKPSCSISVFSYFGWSFGESTNKMIVKLQQHLKTFQLTSRVEHNPSPSFGPRSFFMLSFMFSFLCCLKIFSWSHRAILNRRSGEELYITHSHEPGCPVALLNIMQSL